MVFNLLSIVFGVIVLFTFQLSFSFSVFSAIIIILFANIISKLIETKLLKAFKLKEEELID